MPASAAAGWRQAKVRRMDKASLSAKGRQAGPARSTTAAKMDLSIANRVPEPWMVVASRWARARWTERHWSPAMGGSKGMAPSGPRMETPLSAVPSEAARPREQGRLSAKARPAERGRCITGAKMAGSTANRAPVQSPGGAWPSEMVPSRARLPYEAKARPMAMASGGLDSETCGAQAKRACACFARHRACVV